MSSQFIPMNVWTSSSESLTSSHRYFGATVMGVRHAADGTTHNENRSESGEVAMCGGGRGGRCFL
jgi:hypothetical protein